MGDQSVPSCTDQYPNWKSLGKFLTLDETKPAELTEGEYYKYLGQDENIGYIMNY